MRYLTLLLLVAVSTACANAPMTEPRDDEEAIAALYQSWRTAVQASDIQGYLDVLRSDVRLLPPGADAIDGRDNYGRFLVPVFDSATYRIEVHRYPVVEVQGNVAIAEYDYTIHLNLKDPDVGVDEPGALTASKTTARYFDVLVKESGQWLVWRHSWQEYTP